jgi:hypothetical protein
MIPLIPVTIAVVVSAATALYLEKRKRSAVEGVKPSAPAQGEGQVLSVISGLKQKAAARNSELEQIRQQLAEHSRLLQAHEAELKKQDQSLP